MRESDDKRLIVSPADKDLMMEVLIRSPLMFSNFREELQVDVFSEVDRPYALLWQIVLDTAKLCKNKLPGQELLLTKLGSFLHEQPNYLIKDQWDALENLVLKAYDPETWDGQRRPDDETVEEATAILKRYMQERVVSKLQDSIIGRGKIVSNVPDFLAREAQVALRLSELGDEEDEPLFTPGWDKELTLDLRSTKISFIDSMLDGGVAPGELVGIMGPYGSCKTTIGTMLAVQGALEAYHATIQPEWDGRVGFSFYFSYEATREEMRIRALCYAAQVPRDSLQSMGKVGLDNLSTRKTKKEYEKKLYGESGLGEQGRCKLAAAYLNKHLVVVDMTGAPVSTAVASKDGKIIRPKRRSAGRGYVQEIASYIGKYLDRHDGYAQLVVVDYIGLMARRYMDAAGKDESVLRHLIGNAPDKIRNEVTIPYQCPAFLLHQLSGKANSLPTTAKMQHTEAAESKNFAENLDYSIVFSKLDDLQRGQMHQTKHRRSKPVKPLVIQVIGDFGKVIDRADLVVDYSTKTIVAKDESESVVGQVHAKKAVKALSSNKEDGVPDIGM